MAEKGHLQQGKAEPMTTRSLVPDLGGSENGKYYRAILSAALGSIPAVGGVFSAMISLQAEKEQGQLNELLKLWVGDQKEKLEILSTTLHDITTRLDELCTNDEVKAVVLERIQSPEYLNLVRETFRAWDEAATLDKKDKFKKLITNAAAIKLCTDDMVRIFIKWISQYHEYHIQIIGLVYDNPGISPGAIWDTIFANGEQRPKENSARADLYRTLIRDLQTGGVIRQRREVTPDGQFRTKKGQRSSTPKGIMKSPFDDHDEFELSELGQQFVQYVLQDLVPKLESGDPNKSGGE